MTEHQRHKGHTSLVCSQYDIIIVGGGMVGLTSALMFAQRLTPVSKKAVKIAVIEARDYSLKKNDQSKSTRTSDFNLDSRSSAIAPSSVQIFETLALWEILQKHVSPILEVQVSDRGHFGRIDLAHDLNIQKTLGEALGYVIENGWLSKVLADCVNANPLIDFLVPANVKEVQMTANGASLEVCLNNNDQECTLDTELLILADGAHSSLACSLGIESHTYNYQQRALIANVSFEQAHQGVAYERFTSQGPLALLPLGESPESKTASIVWTHPLTSIDEYLHIDETQFLNKLQTAFGYRLGKFIKVGKRDSYPLNLVQAKEQVRRSLVLLGNAAHALHPVAGQGFNLALRDSFVLSHYLVQARKQGSSLGDLNNLHAYLNTRKADQVVTIGVSDNFNRIFSNQKQHLQIGRNLALLGMNFFPPIKQAFFDQMMGRSSRAFKLNI